MALKANDFLTASASIRHEVETPIGDLVVFVKPLTWIQQQQAISQFVDFQMNEGEVEPRIDFGGYYAYVLANCIERTDPPISKKEILNIKPEVGQAIMKVLPSLEGIMESFAGGEVAPLE
jgi:hypothetical protein